MGAAALAHRATERYLNYEIITGRPHNGRVGRTSGTLLAASAARFCCSAAYALSSASAAGLICRSSAAEYAVLHTGHLRASESERAHDCTQRKPAVPGGAIHRTFVCTATAVRGGTSLRTFWAMTWPHVRMAQNLQRSVGRLDDGNRMDGWARANEQPNVCAAEAPACPSEAE